MTEQTSRSTGRRGLKVGTGLAGAATVLIGSGVANAAPDPDTSAGLKLLVQTDRDGRAAKDVTNERTDRVTKARNDFLRTLQTRGQVADAKDVRVLRTKGGSLVSVVGPTKVLFSDEKQWTGPNGIEQESVGIKLSSGDDPVFGGGAGFQSMIKGDACRSTETPAHNFIESCYRKSKQMDEMDDQKDYWGYQRRVTAKPYGYLGNIQYYVKSTYAESGENVAEMTRLSELDPLPGDTVTSNCQTIEVGLGFENLVTPISLCDHTWAIDGGDWGVQTRYASKYEHGTWNQADRGTPHNAAFAMGAKISSGKTAYWWDYSQACFGGAFPSETGCATAVEPG